jgi:pimeloyl-ACP methyl ester carboxylesterase/DNA-binding SARP family transcriptional activator
VLVEVPPVEFARARNGRLAYQRWGEGEDIVSVPPLAQNIEMSWGHPVVVAMLERFGRIGRFLHYDKRGTGASGRISRPPGRDERVDDMRAVMDAAGIERAHLFGSSDGGATSFLFAAAYPERVRSVITFGGGASTVPPAWLSDELYDVVIQRQRELVPLWGTPESPWVDGFAPSLAGDQGFRDWHVKYQRSCCDSETLLDLIIMSIHTDVSEVLPEVRCPVLLLHRTDDRIVDVARSHEAAALLPDARVVEFPGEDHFGYAGDMDPWLDEFERWVRGSVQPVEASARPTSVRVVTMGRFAVEVDGEEVPISAWGSRHARTIVKRLAVARGWPVSRDELFELLWPGETDRRKVGSRLSVQLSTVRRVLRGGVVADRESVRLDLDEVDLDLAMLGDATDDATVVAAWTGEFLPGDTDLPWTAATRAEVATRAAAAGQRLAEDYLRTGMAGRAAEVARRLVAGNPLDLRAHEVLVAALLDTGQHVEAVAAHAAWAAAGDELGVRVAPLDPV